MFKLIVSGVVIILVAIKFLLHLKDAVAKKWREGFSFNYNICYGKSTMGGQESLCGPLARKNTICRCKDNNIGMKLSGYNEDCMCAQSTYPNFY